MNFYTERQDEDRSRFSGLKQEDSLYYKWKLYSLGYYEDTTNEAKVTVEHQGSDAKVTLSASVEGDDTYSNEVVLTSTSFTRNNNEIIDTNNATTELFLTDGEMETLLSEVFD